MNSSLLQKLTSALPGPLKTLGERFDKSPIQTVKGMNEFAQTRSSYIAQTALYGYLKTRMGTRFVEMFEDDVFSKSIQDAAIKVFSSCLADMTVFSVATALKTGQLNDEEARLLARQCYDAGIKNGLTDKERLQVPQTASVDFDTRVNGTDWAHAAEGENAFAGSGRDLIRYAPVIEEYKKLDDEIVTNSIRFRWRDVREQARKRLDGAAICSAWKAQSG